MDADVGEEGHGEAGHAQHGHGRQVGVGRLLEAALRQHQQVQHVKHDARHAHGGHHVLLHLHVGRAQAGVLFLLPSQAAVHDAGVGRRRRRHVVAAEQLPGQRGGQVVEEGGGGGGGGVVAGEEAGVVEGEEERAGDRRRRRVHCGGWRSASLGSCNGKDGSGGFGQ